MARITKNITFEHARIVYRNFAGNETMYTPAGKRSFALVIEGDDLANQMRSDGWNVKSKEPREGYEDDGLFHTLEVALGDPDKPGAILPIVAFKGSKGVTMLPPDLWSMADTADIEFVDIIIRPYNWVMQEGKPNETRGVKAYLKTIYINLREDDLQQKYAEEPIIGGSYAQDVQNDPGEPGERRDVRFED